MSATVAHAWWCRARKAVNVDRNRRSVTTFAVVTGQRGAMADREASALLVIGEPARPSAAEVEGRRVLCASPQLGPHSERALGALSAPNKCHGITRRRGHRVPPQSGPLATLTVKTMPAPKKRAPAKRAKTGRAIALGVSPRSVVSPESRRAK